LTAAAAARSRSREACGSGAILATTGSLLDHFASTAADVPPIELLHTEVPSPVTTFGVRGVGEVGTIPPGAAAANTVTRTRKATPAVGLR
jgi:carbon-monoxide dehydrogenase large subunit